MQVLGGKWGGGGWGRDPGKPSQPELHGEKLGADVEDLVFTTDFLRLITINAGSGPSWKGVRGRCGERHLLLAEGALKGAQLICAFEGSSRKGHQSSCHPGDQR